MATGDTNYGAMASMLGSGLQAGSSLYSANTSAGSMESQAGWKDYESYLAGQDAEFEALLHMREAKKVVGNQKAAYAASGVRVDVGSPLSVMEETMRMAEVDRITIEMSGKRTQAAATAEASLLRSGASAAKTAGYISAAGSILGGLSSLGGMTG